MDIKRREFLNKLGFWLLILLLVAVLMLIFFRYIYYTNCKDDTCFKNKLQNCDRTKYLSEGKTIYKYYILGRKADICRVQITLLGGEFEEADLSPLQGKSMICYIPLNLAEMPGDNIARCHGVLKEGLQDIMIKKLNFYIAENVGKINYQIYQSLTNKTL